MQDNVIRNIRDVHEVASKMFKCGAKKLKDIHGKGYLGVKLIVGHKLNPAFDPNADPDKSGLTPEERTLEENKANPRVTDSRILWIRPGTTVKELTKDFLMGIKESLETKVPIIEKDATGIDMGLKKGKTDAEIANEVAQGKSSFEKGSPDDDIDEIGFDEGDDSIPAGSPDSDNNPEEGGGEVPEPREEGEKTDEVLEAINTLSANMETLSGDVNSMNDSVNGIEVRLSAVEKEPKKMGRPKTKK